MAGMSSGSDPSTPSEGSVNATSTASSFSSESSNRLASVIKYLRPNRSEPRVTAPTTTWPTRRLAPKGNLKLSIDTSRTKIPHDFFLVSPQSPRDPDPYRRPSLPVPSPVFIPGLEEHFQQAGQFLGLRSPTAEYNNSSFRSRQDSADLGTSTSAEFIPRPFLNWQLDVQGPKSAPLLYSTKSPRLPGIFPRDHSRMSSNQTGTGLYDDATLNPASAGNPMPSMSPGPTTAQPSAAGPTNLSGLVCNVHRTTGKEPNPLVGATTTILGDKLYVFGGRMLSKTRPELTSDLYELDLIRRHWTKLETTGSIPPPRYFHSVCGLGDTKLVCYGGMSPRNAIGNSQTSASTGASSSQQSAQDAQPEVVVMSDVHIFDVPTRTWTFIPISNTPQGRYAHCATILPSSATFTSANAPLSAIHHNPASSNPHQGTIGVEIDGHGGAEMVVVGGQDSSNHYIEQISVFNLRSLKWTVTSLLGRSCGAYRSVVSPLPGLSLSDIGSGAEENQGNAAQKDPAQDGSLMLIYSNYNFLDVKLELQVRLPDGRLVEKPMQSQISPPGLRFPNGGVINGHFIVSGTYLTTSKQEYALWALDLKTLTWGRIDAGGGIFGHGSWNRGVLWNRRSTFVILGHRKRVLVDDYNHRRINFSHICFVELEAFGLYDNPRRSAPTSAYVSVSAPVIPASLQPKFSQQSVGGRPYSSAAEELGCIAQSLGELSDMELLTLGGERIPVNSHILARRWGPYFIQLLRESTALAGDNNSDVATLRQQSSMHPSRNSSITITPSLGHNSNYSQASTLLNPSSSNQKTAGLPLPNLEIPSAHSLTPTSRPRSLYLPHTRLTVQLLVHYLYTSSLPPAGSTLCTPQILCSLLQLARPYQVDGLLEATVERLHEVLDGRNAAAVFNAAAMAAGGGRGTGFTSGPGGTLEVLNGVNASTSSINSVNEPMSSLNLNSNSSDESGPQSSASGAARRRASSAQRPANLRINTSFIQGNGIGDRDRAESLSSNSTATSASTSTSVSFTDSEMGGRQGRGGNGKERGEREIWTGEMSSVVGLQKRGLRGLMEGRRLRERGGKNQPGAPEDGNAGLGLLQSAGSIASAGLGSPGTNSASASGSGNGKMGLGIS